MPLQEIISQLPFLSSDELDRLHQRIKALKGSSEPKMKKSNGAADVEMVQGVICHVLNSRGIMWSRKFIKVEGQLDKVKSVIEYVEKAVHERIRQEALLIIAIDLLWQDMARQHLPTTGNTLLRNLHRIPAIMDCHFPGYAKAGLLKLIIGQHQGIGSHERAATV